MTPEQRKKRMEYAREWRRAYPEKNKESCRRWASANPDKVIELAHKQAVKKKEKNDESRKTAACLTQKWSLQEERILQSKKYTDEQLAKLFKRTIASIQQKRDRLNTLGSRRPIYKKRDDFI